MEGVLFESEHPKKRRRRRPLQQPLPARLVLDHNLRGHVGIGSEKLWHKLLAADIHTHGKILAQPYTDSRLRISILDGSPHRDGSSNEHAIFVAIYPRIPLAPITEDVLWTTLRIQKQREREGYESGGKDDEPTIRFPANTSLPQSFLRQLESLDPHQLQRFPPSTIEIYVVKVRPLALDTLYVTVDRSLLEDVDNAQTKFGGGFEGRQPKNINRPGRPQRSKTGDGHEAYWDSSGSTQERLTRVLREAVRTPPVIHTGDELQIPLPSHPITHIPPPPAIVTACEPVCQGSVSPDTRIVLLQTKSGPYQATARETLKPAAWHIGDDDADDTSNDQFFSAAEDRHVESTSEEEAPSEQSDSENSSRRDSESVSDDSLEDMISLHAPDLHSQRSIWSSGTAHDTPRPSHKRYDNSLTPGSLHSSFTATTTRAGPRAGKVCQAEVLVHQIPVAALHPRPAEGDDHHCFVFVDVSTLTKIGCFSGDWVRLEKCGRPSRKGANLLNLGTAGSPGDESTDWRAVRIFGLSNIAARKPRYAVSGRNSSTLTASLPGFTPVVYLSPVLLYNVGGPSFVELSTLPKSESKEPRLTMKPPIAKEITLGKVATPFSTKKEVQSSLFAAIKDHFQSSPRILKEGDLIAIALDEEIGRVTSSLGQSGESGVPDVVAAQLGSSLLGAKRKLRLAWFTIDQVMQANLSVANGDTEEENIWGGVVLIDSSTTRMAQIGNGLRGIPETLARNTAMWLGAKKTPINAALPAAGFVAGGRAVEPYVSPLQKRLTNLICAATSPTAIALGMRPLAILLSSTQRQVGKSYHASAACAAAGTHAFTISAHDVLADAGSPNGGGDSKTEMILKTMAERALSCGSRFTALLITHLEALTADRMTGTLSTIISESRVVIATTTELQKVPDGTRNLFTHELELTAPNESERTGILHNACLQLSMSLDTSVNLKNVALKTAALVAGDLVDVVRRASLARHQRIGALAASKGVSESEVRYAGGPFVSNVLAVDFEEAISRARSTFSDSIGAPKIPTVTWNDVGGLADQKSSIIETISLPLTHPQLFAKGMRKRSGILFYGPPGTGKTLLAKAIATEFSLNFFSVKGPELLNMYIGESEANVRRVFQRARDARPCVVFFDELDSVAPKRGNQGDSGGVMDRIVSQLLAELDGMSSSGSTDDALDGGGGNGNSGGVFVIGATNRPDLLDPALLRPGRFDKMLYLGVSSTHEQQVPILEALTRKFTLASGLDLARVAERLPLTYTGADLYALCSDAMLKAITKKTKQIDAKVRDASSARGDDISTAYYFDHLATADDTAVVVGEQDFASAQRELNASVSAKELTHFERIRKQFEQQDLSSSGGSGKVENSRPGPATLTTWASLPRREQNGPKTFSPKPAERQNDNSIAIKATSKGKEKSIANPDSGPDNSGDDSERHLMANGASNGSVGVGKGKGKGKASVADGFFDTEEDLYI